MSSNIVTSQSDELDEHVSDKWSLSSKYDNDSESASSASED